MLTLDRVSKTYRKGRTAVEAMQAVSLRVAPGEFVAVMGPSGCGKSTLLLASGTLLSPDAGTVRIRETDPYALAPNRRAAFRAGHVGFLFQQFHLIPYLSARDNVLVAAVSLAGPQARRRADELLERFGLRARAAHVPSELSVGERQRIGLARALLAQPPLLLADEPTGNLDEASGQIVLEALAQFAVQGGAVLMVTHDPRAAALAARVVRMDRGRLA
jgi:putative ABC transport system ATP-binding protein